MEKNIENQVELLRNKKRSITLVGISLAIIVIILIAVFVKGYSNAKKKYDDELAKRDKQIEELTDAVLKYEKLTKEVSISVIEAKIMDIGELATIEYLYTNAGKFEDSEKALGIKLPFSTKSFIAKWDGIIKAGVKMDQVKVKIDKKDKVVTITIPKAEILSHEIDNDSIETLDQKDGMFNKVTVDDVRDFDKASKEDMTERAIENGVLEKAMENAKVIIERLVNTDVVKEQGYAIKFEVIE